MQTGGDRRTWIFDHNDIDAIPALRDAFIHYDHYFFEEHGDSTLAIVMDKLLEELPEDLEACVRLVHLRGKSLRATGKILGIDHKTVKLRCEKGIAAMKARLVDSVWIGEMLRGYIPADELKSHEVKANKVTDIVKGLKDE